MSMCCHSQEFETCTFGCTFRKAEELRLELDMAKEENKRLKKFARPVIETECWSLSEQDGGYLQELAEKLGLIVSYTVTEEDADDENGVGETKCKFSDTLKESDHEAG